MLPTSSGNLRAHAVSTLFVRFKTAKFKPKIAATRKTKTPSMVALDHFDFYYGPAFGSHWPSVRLGLLTPNKYVAVINTLSDSWEANKQLLTDLGTDDLIKRLVGKTASERIEEKKKKTEEKSRRETAEILTSKNEEDSSSVVEPDSSIAARLDPAAALEFTPPKTAKTIGQMQLGRVIEQHVKEFDITGYEGMDSSLPCRPHFIYYPRELQIRTFDRGNFSDYPPSVRNDAGVPGWWLLDGGSVVPVLALGLQEGENVLDVCAAPGGKSLAITLTKLPAKLVCNDAKMSRLGQLKRALSTYIPSEHPISDRVILKRKDAASIQTWDEFGVYDKVLADVPCSTDRLAVAQDDGNLFAAQHTNARLNLPYLQTKILINSIRALRVGGSVVYSTCTLASAQNEAVVENAAAVVEQRFGIKVVEESLSTLREHLTSSGLFRFSDATTRGILCLPFLPANFGPMYVCKLTRLQ